MVVGGWETTPPWSLDLIFFRWKVWQVCFSCWNEWIFDCDDLTWIPWRGSRPPCPGGGDFLLLLFLLLLRRLPRSCVWPSWKTPSWRKEWSERVDRWAPTTKRLWWGRRSFSSRDYAARSRCPFLRRPARTDTGRAWGRHHRMHWGLEQTRIETWVLGHSLVRSLIRSHRSLIRWLRTAALTRSLTNSKKSE